MTFLVAYQKVIDEVTTHYIRTQEAEGGSQGCKELCTLADGRTIVAVFTALAEEQPEPIRASIKKLTAKQKEAIRDEVKQLSPHVRLIDATVVEKISARYSITDEIKLLRLADPVQLEAYNAYVEECRAWGAAEKAKLGL